MRGHAHNSDVTCFDACIAGNCTIPSVKTMCTRFPIMGRKHDNGETRSPHATRHSLDPRGLLFSTAATSETSHPRSLLSVSSGTLLKLIKILSVLAIPEFQQQPRFCCSNNNLCTRKTEMAMTGKRGCANWNYDACHMWHSKVSWKKETLGMKKKQKNVLFDRNKLDFYCRQSQAATAWGILQRMTLDQLGFRTSWLSTDVMFDYILVKANQEWTFSPPRTPSDLIKQLLL